MGRAALGEHDRLLTANVHFERRTLADVRQRKRDRIAAYAGHAAGRFDPTAIAVSKNRGMKRNRRKLFEPAHFAGVEIGRETIELSDAARKVKFAPASPAPG